MPALQRSTTDLLLIAFGLVIAGTADAKLGLFGNVQENDTSQLGVMSMSAVKGVPCGGVIISEFMYDPTEEHGSDSKGEWIEILNNGCDDVDLTGWQVGDSYKRTTMTALDNETMILNAGQYALIIGDDSTVQSTYSSSIAPDTRIFLSGGSVIGNQLNDKDGDDVILSDADGIAVDKVTYVVGAECTGGATSGAGDGAAKGGMSMERIDPLGPSDCSNFIPSQVEGGSPGSENHSWTGAPITVPCTCIVTKPVGRVQPCESIIITEVMYDPVGSDLGQEWIEILNNGINDVDLSGWKLGDLAGSNGFSSPDDSSMLLEAGEYAVIVESDSTLSFPPEVRTFFGGSRLGAGLNNGGDTLFIINSAGSVIDTVTYVDQAPDGTSLERIDAGPGVVANFQASISPGGSTPGVGTPGVENAEPACKAQCKPKSLDVCIAIDRSGSICTRDNEKFVSCKGVSDCGCDDWESGVDFVNDFIFKTNELHETKRFGLVGFATTARTERALADYDEVMNSVIDLRYTAGWTNTGAAIQSCRDMLSQSEEGVQRAILLVTDGAPTRPDSSGTGAPFREARDVAKYQAEEARKANITIMTVFIETATGRSDYLKDNIASDGFYLEVDEPSHLDKASEGLSNLVQCA